MQKILFSLALITSGLMLGYYIQCLVRQYNQRHAVVLPRLRKSLQRISMLGIMPIAFVGVTWIISFDDLRVALVPLIGAGVLISGGVLGLLAATVLKKEGKQKSVLFCCGAFTNLGAFGSLVSFIYFGERGFALVALYKVFEELIYYGLGFPIARYLGQEDADLKIKSRLFALFKDPFFVVATSSLVAGLVLNFSGVTRPLFYEMLNSFFVPIGTFLLLVSIGLGIRFSNMRHHLVEGLLISTIKFLLLPLLAVGAGYLLGMGDIQDGLPLKVVILCASMPVAFNALVAASIYDLDLDLANSCWLMTTVALLVVVPILSVLFSFF